MPIEVLLERIAHDDTPCGVAAECLGETGPADLDGRRWVLRATDGISLGEIELELSGSEGGMTGVEFDAATIAAAAESIAGKFPREQRLKSMAAYCEHIGALTLHRSDLGA